MQRLCLVWLIGTSETLAVCVPPTVLRMLLRDGISKDFLKTHSRSHVSI